MVASPRDRAPALLMWRRSGAIGTAGHTSHRPTPATALGGRASATRGRGRSATTDTTAGRGSAPSRPIPRLAPAGKTPPGRASQDSSLPPQAADSGRLPVRRSPRRHPVTTSATSPPGSGGAAKPCRIGSGTAFRWAASRGTTRGPAMSTAEERPARSRPGDAGLAVPPLDSGRRSSPRYRQARLAATTATTSSVAPFGRPLGAHSLCKCPGAHTAGPPTAGFGRIPRRPARIGGEGPAQYQRVPGAYWQPWTPPQRPTSVAKSPSTTNPAGSPYPWRALRGQTQIG